MKQVHIRSLDLNLLVIARSLFKHRNVSRASEELGLSQSAVSHALARLRIQLNDPLFVRTSKGISPTEYARKIQSDLDDVMSRLEVLTLQRPEFKLAEARGRITIASTDYFEIVMMPKLLKIMSANAPHVQISLRPTQGDLPKRELEEGSIDLAVAGFYRNLPEGFYQSKLFVDHFQTAAGKGHPLFKLDHLSKSEYLQARHALITLQGDFKDGSAKQASSNEREIVYGSYSFTGMAWVLQESDLLLTAPSLLISQYERYFPLKIWKTPIDRSTLDIRMLWHEQTHKDPLRSWIRQTLKKISQDQL